MAIYEKQQNIRPFKLSDEFLEPYKTRNPKFGFNGLGELTYRRTYSRLQADGTKEEWWQTIRRVIEGVYNMQKKWVINNNLGWDNRKAQQSAQEMYERMFSMKFLPAGRGLWAWGTPLTEEKELFMALNSCAMITTENIKDKLAEPFCFLMDASMLGVGVGFDTKGNGKITIYEPDEENPTTIVIEDSREGWVQSLESLLLSYFLPNQKKVIFDYSEIRPAGSEIKGFGGISSGSEALKEMHESIREFYKGSNCEKITGRQIADTMNVIARCVISGNVRRAALIALGDANDEEFLNLKNYDDNPERLPYGWTSNNSVFGELGQDYSKIAERIRSNGEPGIVWIENARAYSRMIDAPDYKDIKVAGVNPCITGDTMVAVADGRDYVTIKELAEEGKDVDVYSMANDGSVVIRKMRNPRLTGTKQDIYEVTLDSGDKLKVTGNHKFIMKDGSTKKTIDLAYGDSLSIMTKFWDTIPSIRKLPENPRFRPEYAHIIDTNGDIIAEHVIVGEHKYGEKRKPGYHVHHLDYNCKNNSPDNLIMMPSSEHRRLHMAGDINPMRRAKKEWSKEKWNDYKEKLSKANSGKNNSKFSGITNDEIKAHALKLANFLGRRFSVVEWKKYALENNIPSQFSEYRTNELGSVLDMSYWAAEKTGKDEFSDLDPRTVRYYHDMLDQGYACDIIDGQVVFYKKCEMCGNDFNTTKREVSLCSHTCGNHLSWVNETARKNRLDGQRKYFDNKKHSTRVAQLEVYKNLENKLKRTPLRKEWEESCKDAGVSSEISRKSSPFTSYALLQKTASAYNHKVVSIKLVGQEDVYNGTVDEFHNFAIGKLSGSLYKNGIVSVFNLQCGEQSLESQELCLLVETFPAKAETLEDYKRTLKFAYLYAKTVTLTKTHWAETNRVMLRNRRIGLSMSGIAQFISKHGLKELKAWCEDGYQTIKYYDNVYSDWLCIPKSIKVTSIKPSGSVSLLAGATPGIHFPESNFYIRRMRLSVHSDLINPLISAGYNVEPAVGQEDSTMVVEIPITVGKDIRTIKDVSMWEQLALGAFMQRYWSDNQVSQTVSFNPNTEGKDIANALDIYQYQLKGVSFLPALDYGAYPQMPYEAITEEEYNNMVSKIKPLDFAQSLEDARSERFCDNDICSL